jgi:hypothetical protein
MAEPENFEDDLFADLYDDNEAAPAAAPAAAPVPQYSHPVPEAPANTKPDAAPDNGAGHIQGDGYGGDYQEENYDDDDDVDFNLGNGSAGITTASAPPARDEVSTPTYNSRGPSAKEDG